MERPAAEHTVGYLVKRVQQALRRQCDSALKPTGLSMAQYAVLRALADHPDASAAELARLCFVTRQSLQDVLVGLRVAELVTDSDSPARGRAQSLALTASGRRRLAGADSAVMSVDAAMLDGIALRRQAELSELLTCCALNLEQAAG